MPSGRHLGATTYVKTKNFQLGNVAARHSSSYHLLLGSESSKS